LRTLLLDSNGIRTKRHARHTRQRGNWSRRRIPTQTPPRFFDREYLAISDGRSGNDLPRPVRRHEFRSRQPKRSGAGPTVVDENVIVAITASPNGATQPAPPRSPPAQTAPAKTAFSVTITTTAAHGLSADNP